MGDSRIQGCQVILSNGLESQIFPLGCCPFWMASPFPGALLSQVLSVFSYNSKMLVGIIDNVFLGYIDWKLYGGTAKNRGQQ